MINFLSIARDVAIIALLVGAYMTGRDAGKHNIMAKWEAERAAQLQQLANAQAAQGEAFSTTVIKLAEADKEKDNAMDVLHRDYAGLLARVQSHPDRPAVMPATTTAASDQQITSGATGAQLYRADGAFLAGEAARADELRIALQTCYKQYDVAAGVK